MQILMNNSTTGRHQFALYIESLHDIVHNTNKKGLLHIDDEQLAHRIVHILRLGINDTCILFDQFYQAQASLVGVVKKKILSFTIQPVAQNTQLKPDISILLPLLKRDALEDTVYGLTEVGVNTIQLVITQKVHRTWGGAKEHERLQRVIISAAEQSKNFSFPTLIEPIQYLNALQQCATDEKFFFDHAGNPTAYLCAKLLNKTTASDSIAILIGPEGDLTAQEKITAQKHGFEAYMLTPTILRSTQAASLAAGIIRSIMCVKQ